MEDLRQALQERVLVIDGAMGTMIQQYGLEEKDFRGERFANLPGVQKGNNDLLTLTRPDVIGGIHERYLRAGADIIETNTFNSQKVSMKDYGCEHLCRELNLAAVRLARGLADKYSTLTPDKKRYVVGSIGPTNKSCAIGTDTDNPAARNITFDELNAAYEEQISALLEGGVDALLMETFYDTLNLKAALLAAETCMSRDHIVPIMVSVSLAGSSGRLLSGQTLPALLASISHLPLLSVGLNCSFGARDMKPHLKELSGIAPCFVSAYPNAGFPDAMGHYAQTGEEMADIIEDFVSEGMVNIVGGCCGTTDEHIAAISRRVERLHQKKIAPRQPKERNNHLVLAGLEPLELSHEREFTPIGERCNVAGSRKFLRLIKEGNYNEALTIARKQIEAGAKIIDINMDDGLLDAEKEMRHFVNLISADPDICRVPFMIDSSKWNVVIAALKCIQGKAIVNSISLKEGEEVFLSHARELHHYGAAVVVMAFDEQGQAVTCSRRVEICRRAFRLLTEEAGMSPSDIIFDPNVLAVCTGMEEHDDYAADFIRAVAQIHREMPEIHISGGISNLSFSFRGHNLIREVMHAVFLHHAVKEGMDFGIINPSTLLHYDEIEGNLRTAVENVILNRPGSAEYLLALAEKDTHEKADSSVVTNGTKSRTATKGTGETSWRKTSVEERLSYALQHGTAEFLKEDLEEARHHYDHSVNIIEGPLMQAMDKVGVLFGEGKMFLPQVVKTARTMKAAVEILTPYIEKENVAGKSKAGHILIATVKGDVHDIGKNIVATVMSCNNYQITDLGVMCPAEDIVEAAQRLHPDFIGLSGLITPSLDEMIVTAQTLRAADIHIPLLLGGATTSPLHTALKIAPAYGGPVFWVKDASQMVLVAARLSDKQNREAFILSHEKEQEELRLNYMDGQKTIHSLEEARKNKLRLFD